MTNPIHSRKLNGLTIKAYNDSGAEWVVWCEDSFAALQRFDARKFTRHDAMKFFADTAVIHNEYSEFIASVNDDGRDDQGNQL